MNLADITPLILTWNEDPNLGRSLEMLRWASQVIVLDSGSTDSTEAVAMTFANVHFRTRSFDSHTAQWNFGLDQVVTEWVLALDADYVLDDEFPNELSRLEPDSLTDAFFARFKYLIFGIPLRGSLYPPRAVLFRKERCRYEPDGHTQLLRTTGRTSPLTAFILHDDRKPLSRWLVSQDNYAKLEAEKLIRADPATLRLQDRLRVALVPAAPLAFFYTLFIRGTILDGWRGWYYTLQRVLAEVVLSLRLLERRLKAKKDE